MKIKDFYNWQQLNFIRWKIEFYKCRQTWMKKKIEMQYYNSKYTFLNFRVKKKKKLLMNLELSNNCWRIQKY